MAIIVLTLLSALAVSAVAGYFSIVGLMAIFATAPIPIAVMGSTLEIAKLITASWLYRNWWHANIVIKYYFAFAVVVLSVITSMGIFGYLSKAHMDQSLVTGDVSSKVAIYDDKIRTAKENIDAHRKALKQMDEAVDQVMARSSDEKGADKASALRRSQSKERAALASNIETEQKRIAQLNEERAPIAAEVRKVEAEVGPIKYIAALIYGDNPDQNLLERAVRWVIILIVSVFDPLAILLLIAANISIRMLRENDDMVYEEQVASFTDMLTDTKETEVEEPPKETWSKELYNRKNIDKSRLYTIPKEILDKVFKK